MEIAITGTETEAKVEVKKAEMKTEMIKRIEIIDMGGVMERYEYEMLETDDRGI